MEGSSPGYGNPQPEQGKLPRQGIAQPGTYNLRKRPKFIAHFGSSICSAKGFKDVKAFPVGVSFLCADEHCSLRHVPYQHFACRNAAEIGA